jgi:hypothetical protein
MMLLRPRIFSHCFFHVSQSGSDTACPSISHAAHWTTFEVHSADVCGSAQVHMHSRSDTVPPYSHIAGSCGSAEADYGRGMLPRFLLLLGCAQSDASNGSVR